jgi:NADPH:quinone reductase
MRAVGYFAPGPITAPDSLVDIELPRPSARGRDLLVEVRAISVNPVDYKVRSSAAPSAGAAKVIGYDAAGVVVEAGPDASLFRPGDEVFYAGSVTRSGTNAEFQLVDERIVGRKPRSLGFAEAAALPLTSITAWEALFDRMDIRKPVAGAAPAVLIIGGAGGVSSIAIQLVRALTDLTVVATASRPETMSWVKDLGAHHVIDHGKPIAAQVAGLGMGAPGFVFSTTHTAEHLKEIVELIAPQGRLALINNEPLELAIVDAQERLNTLGIDVYSLNAPNCRHDRAACAARQSVKSGRCRQNPHHGRRALRHHQRSQPQARARAARDWQGPRQDRARGVPTRTDIGAIALQYVFNDPGRFPATTKPILSICRNQFLTTGDAV